MLVVRIAQLKDFSYFFSIMPNIVTQATQQRDMHQRCKAPIESRIYTHYLSVICQDIIYAHNVPNIMQLPRITQCVLNTTFPLQPGVGYSANVATQVALQSIGGQKEKATRARKSIAAFQIRENAVLGCALNLRKKHLFSFLDHFITIHCPSIYRKKISRKKAGNQDKYNIGVERFTLFSELQPHFLLLSNTPGLNCEICASEYKGPLGLESKKVGTFLNKKAEKREKHAAFLPDQPWGIEKVSFGEKRRAVYQFCARNSSFFSAFQLTV